jgi:hypothetical protein
LPITIPYTIVLVNRAPEDKDQTMKYESIKHSFLIILIATTIVGCAGNSVQPPASQYHPLSSTQNGESIVSRDDTSSIDVEDVDKEAITNQESEYSLANLGRGLLNITAFGVAIPVVTFMAAGKLFGCVVGPPIIAVYSILADEVIPPGCF